MSDDWVSLKNWWGDDAFFYYDVLVNQCPIGYQVRTPSGVMPDVCEHYAYGMIESCLHRHISVGGY